MTSRSGKLAKMHFLLQELLQGSEIEERQIIAIYWKKHFPDLARHAVLDELKDGRLKIRVDSSLWLQQIYLQREAMRQALNKRVKKELIKEIHVRIGNIVEEE